MASQVPPKKNTAFNLGLCLYKNDGTLIANPGTITAKVSKDFGNYADVGTVTEEDSTYGQIKLALTTTEMNADVVMIYVVDDTADCVPFTVTIYTAANLLDDIKTDTAAILADTGTDGVVLAADAITAAKIADDAISSEHLATGALTADAFAADAIVAATLATGAITADAVATGAIASTAFAAGAINAAAVASGAIDADALAADAGTEIATAVWASVARTLTALDEDSTTIDLNNTAIGSVAGNVSGSVGSIGTGGITAASFAANAVDAAALSDDAVDAILDEVVEGSTTLRQMLRGFTSALLSKVSGAGTATVTFRDVGDTKNRIVATCDADGNRSVVTLTLT